MHPVKLIGILLACIASVNSGPVQILEDFDVTNTRNEGDPYRLPTAVIPTEYDLLVVFNENFGDSASYTGSVAINFTANQETSNITLHSLDLVIDYSTLSVTCEASNVVIFSIAYNDTYEMLYITFVNSIPLNTPCRLEVSFTGGLHDDMRGLYRSYYHDENNNLIWIATTQFQPTAARRAFPCFDEPSFKSIFNIRIAHPTTYHSLSNTPQLGDSEQYLDTNLVIDTFQTTPLVSTYLLAIIVSPFVYQDHAATNYRVYARAEANYTLGYSLEIGPPLLQSLNNFTNIEYLSTGIGKMDQVAIPDFSAGAMENWGLVTYRERLLLWDPAESTNLDKHSIATVISHEFAHMWFGNLVTCDWWTWTWLNEGFARYFEFFTTHDVETTWELDKQFVVRQQQSIFVTDSLAAAPSLNNPASSPAQIMNKFAALSYNKAGSVIRMMEHFMGSENFRNGLRAYLEEHQWRTTRPNDLWTSLQPFAAAALPAGRTLEQVMSKWTDEPGYPVLEVRMDGPDAVITQKRFFLNPAESSDMKWDIPISYTTSHEHIFTNTTPYTWFLAENNEIRIPNIVHGGTGWIVLNVRESAYYRVNYEDALWDQLEQGLKSEDFDGIDVINRAQIVDDALNLARAGEITYDRALDILSYLENEDEYYPWFAAFNGFSFLGRRIGLDDHLEHFLNSFLTRLLTSVYSSVPFNEYHNDNQIFSLKKILIANWACQLGVPDCIQNAINAFRNFKINGISVNSNLKSTVYCTALREEDTEENWNFLWNTFTNTKLGTEQVLILNALGCTRNQTLINGYLQRSISPDSGIRSQDANLAFVSVYDSNPEGVDIAFQFLQENYANIADFYGSMNGLGGLITGLSDRFTRQDQVTSLQTFLEEHEHHLGSAALVIQSSIETARANIEWTESFSEVLHGWFIRNNSAFTISVNYIFIVLLFGVNFLLQ